MTARDDLNPSELVLDAQAYRTLRDAIVATMDDPNRWDGDEDEGTILARYVQWLADGRPDEDTEGKSSRPAADATPGLTARQKRLRDAIRTHGGPWTTRRVLSLYQLTDPGVVQRGTARRDLAALHRAGHLVLVDDPGNRHYVLRRKDAR